MQASKLPGVSRVGGGGGSGASEMASRKAFDGLGSNGDNTVAWHAVQLYSARWAEPAAPGASGTRANELV